MFTLVNWFPENIEGRSMSVTYVGFEKRKSRVVEEVSKSPPLLATEEPEKTLNIDANNNQQVQPLWLFFGTIFRQMWGSGFAGNLRFLEILP